MTHGEIYYISERADLLGGDKCSCGNDQVRDTDGSSELGEMMYECTECGRILWGCD